MTAQSATHGQSLISHSFDAPVVTRFAPSPTGYLHLGHALSAICAHDRARAANGRFIVRIEDIDSGRSRPDFVDAIFDDLRWLGLTWDDVVVQSDRREAYRAALDQLYAAGLAYRCVCTRAEIASSAAAPHGDAPAAYPGTCRGRLIPDDALAASRLAMEKAVAQAVALASEHDSPLEWVDQRAGRIDADPMPWGDVVIARKDALASYHLAVVVDDAAQGVTHVTRGRDLFAATHVHRVLQAVLGLPTPLYDHHPLVLGANGMRLAKRDGAASLAALRASGLDGHDLAETVRNGRLPIGFTIEAP